MIWGIKTVSVFDVWTFEHLLSGISIGALAMYINTKVFKNRFKVSNENNHMTYFDILFVSLIINNLLVPFFKLIIFFSLGSFFFKIIINRKLLNFFKSKVVTKTTKPLSFIPPPEHISILCL